MLLLAAETAGPVVPEGAAWAGEEPAAGPGVGLGDGPGLGLGLGPGVVTGVCVGLGVGIGVGATGVKPGLAGVPAS